MTAIAAIDARILRGSESVEARERCVLVSVTAEDGTTGFAEAAAAPEAVRAFILRRSADPWDLAPIDALVGQPATDPAALRQRMRESAFWSARSGLGHVALAAIDTALWDLAGRLAGRPVHALLGPAVRSACPAYVTLYHGPRSTEDAVRAAIETVERGRALGFEAFKLEAMPDTTPTADDVVRLVRDVRRAVGDDVTLMLDVGYRWRDAGEAIGCVERLEDAGLRFLESPFPPHLVEAHRRLRAATAIPIATGDILTSQHEYQHLLASDAIDIVQAGSARTGISDMLLLAEAAARGGAEFISWGWCSTAMTTAANIHVSAVCPNVPLVEYAPPALYPGSPLRAELAAPEPRTVAGAFALPDAPGLGPAPDPDAVERFAAFEAAAAGAP